MLLPVKARALLFRANIAQGTEDPKINRLDQRRRNDFIRMPEERIDIRSDDERPRIDKVPSLRSTTSSIQPDS